jgi:hypothetical protein
VRRTSALRRLLSIAAVAAGLTTFPTPSTFAQSCPTLPTLSALPRRSVLDIWAPSATQAPIYFVAPDPMSTYALFAPVHATLLPPGTLAPDGTPIADIRIMLFGRAGDRVKAASFTPTPLGQPLPAAVLLSAESTPHLTTNIFDDASGNHWYNSDTLFCSGHSLMANGDIFVAGGTELYSIASPDRTTTVDLLYGLEYATHYSSFTGAGNQWTKIDASFSPGQSNLPRRWYSAVTRLADSRMLVTSGLDFVTLNSTDGDAPGRSARLFGLQLAIVRLDEGADVVGQVEQLGPLLLVERDGKPAQPVHGDSALLADLHRDAACGLGLQRGVLGFESLDFRVQRIVSHRRSPRS